MDPYLTVEELLDPDLTVERTTDAGPARVAPDRPTSAVLPDRLTPAALPDRLTPAARTVGSACGSDWRRLRRPRRSSPGSSGPERPGHPVALAGVLARGGFTVRPRTFQLRENTFTMGSDCSPNHCRVPITRGDITMDCTASESEREQSSGKQRDSERGRDTGRSRDEGSVAALHQSAGNQAVKELHERGELQAKLEVSQPNDPAEREAERVATRVMRMSDADRSTDIEGGDAVGGTSASKATERQIESLTVGGRPLPRPERSYFGPRFGRDFDDVRIHTGDRAARAADDIGARAFTYGRHVVFNSGEFRPDTTDGRRLLAHELTHVVQQSGTGTGSVQRQQIPIGEDGGDARSFDTSEELASYVDEQLVDEVEAQAHRNINTFSVALESAWNSFEGTADDLIGEVNEDDQAKQWAKFGFGIAGLSAPALAALVGLNPPAVLGAGTIVTTLQLGSVDYPGGNPSSASDPADAKNATRELIDSIWETVNETEPRGYAEAIGERTKEESIGNVVNEHSVKLQAQDDLWQTDLLNESGNLDGNEVRSHVTDELERLWNLLTVDIQAEQAHESEAPAFGVGTSEEALDAFTDTVEEQFSDWQRQMRRHMPRRYQYWVQQAEGGEIPIDGFNRHAFKRDINVLGDIVAHEEFGTERTEERPQTGPRLEAP